MDSAISACIKASPAMIDLIGWFGNIFIIVGIIGIAYKCRSGFILGVVGNSLWCVKGIVTKQWDLVSIEVIIVILQALSYWKWGRINVESNDELHPRTASDERPV